jgi:hypothetical protein
MNDAALASAFIAARIAQVQMAVAAKMLRMNAEAAQSAAKIVQAAEQNFDRLANVAAGIGTNVDVSI